MIRAMKILPLLMVAAFGLSGCFDLTQGVSINKDGSGTYELAIAAKGTIGNALKDDKNKTVHFGHNPNLHPRNKTEIVNGVTVNTTSVDFKQLSDLDLSNESVAIKVHGHDLFGLGQTHAVFRRTFLVGNEVAKRQDTQEGDKAGAAVIAAIFGDHSYVFRVHLPGQIDWIAPVTAGGVPVRPEIHPDATGNTIIWRMPFTSLIESGTMRFSVGFSTYGALKDSETMLDTHGGDRATVND
ncbi:MAG TPA: hypothetical protein VGF56_17280 [Rhizomicrobium sp.]|jgi:hypothetical protein